MRRRCQDVRVALAGTKLYKIGNPISVVLPVEDASVVSPLATQATMTSDIVA